MINLNSKTAMISKSIFVNQISTSRWLMFKERERERGGGERERQGDRETERAFSSDKREQINFYQ